MRCVLKLHLKDDSEVAGSSFCYPKCWGIMYKAMAEVPVDLCPDVKNCGTFGYLLSGTIHLESKCDFFGADKLTLYATNFFKNSIN